MTTYTLEKCYPPSTADTPRCRMVRRLFGYQANPPQEVLAPTAITLEPGQLVFITGSSGAGKSTLLHLLKEKLAGVLDLAEVKLPPGKPMADCLSKPLHEAMQWLRHAGLSEPPSLLRPAEQLSEGQRYRLRLALALVRQPAALAIDEFANTLDRVTAAAVAANLRKLVDKTGTTVLVATSHDDILEDLAPDVVIVKHYGKNCDVYYPTQLRQTAIEHLASGGQP